MSEFLAMGGYAKYVWPCYGLAVLMLVANFWQPRHQERQILKQIRSRVQRLGDDA